MSAARQHCSRLDFTHDTRTIGALMVPVDQTFAYSSTNSERVASFNDFVVIQFRMASGNGNRRSESLGKLSISSSVLTF